MGQLFELHLKGVLCMYSLVCFMFCPQASLSIIFILRCARPRAWGLNAESGLITGDQALAPGLEPVPGSWFTPTGGPDGKEFFAGDGCLGSFVFDPAPALLAKGFGFGIFCIAA
jgi:hypothetical protein